MLKKESETLLSRLLLFGPAGVTVLVFTSGVTDPVNANKLLALGVLSFAALGILSRRTFAYIFKSHKVLMFTILGFLTASINSLIQSESPLSQLVYGVYGRNNGLLLYLFLVILFFATVSMSRIETAKYLVYSLIVAGIINLIYCAWVIYFGDFLGWSNPYGNILGTFGNPNFIGAFLGMFSSVLVSLAITNYKNPKFVVFLICVLMLTVYEIIKSQAIQGRVLLAFGLMINGFYLIRSKYLSKFPLMAYSVVSFLVSVLAGLGTLQIGPMTRFLYKESVSLRGEYWYAAFSMGNQKLLSGVGFDSYGDWYRESRRASALVKPGAETISNTAHNAYLDIFAFGGLPLLISYIVMILLVIISIVRHTRRNPKFDFVFVSLVGAWLCFQLQSVISINQVGLVIWGWVLGAGLIAYERLGLQESSGKKDSGADKTTKPEKPQVISPNLRAGIAMLFGVLIAVPPFAADVKWRTAQESRSVEKFEEVLDPSYFNPPTTVKYLRVIELFEQSNLQELSHKYAIEAVKFNPHSYESWKVLTLIQSSTSSEKQIAIARMKELDPKNANILKGHE